MEEREFVETSLQEGVLVASLNRPKANAFNFQMIAELQDTLRGAAKNPAVRVVLLTGAGGIFSAGQDVKEFGQAAEEGELSFRQHLQRTYNPLVLQIRRLEKPVLAALNGPAAGAALGIALACDLRIAADTARLVVGFLGIGLAPDSGVSLFLPALIGLGRAAEFRLRQPAHFGRTGPAVGPGEPGSAGRGPAAGCAGVGQRAGPGSRFCHGID